MIGQSLAFEIQGYIDSTGGAAGAGGDAHGRCAEVQEIYDTDITDTLNLYKWDDRAVTASSRT